MPYYRILLHGENIIVPMDDQDDATGFYTVRHVSAGSREDAEKKAKAQVLATWTSAEYVARNKGTPPLLHIDSVEEIGFFRFILSRSAYGHIYYSKS